jgi:hypothetical protein
MLFKGDDLHDLISPSQMKMTELFAEYQRTSTLFTGAWRVPGSGFAGSREFKRVVKWRISPVFIAWRISDVKAEIRLSRRERNSIAHFS